MADIASAMQSLYIVCKGYARRKAGAMPGRRRLHEHELFVQVFRAAIEQLGGNVSLTASDWRVMAVCMGGMIYGGFIQYSQKQIASKAYLSEAQVSRNLGHLLVAGVLVREHAPKGNQWRYRFNSTLAHMGDTADLMWRRTQDRG